MSISEYQNLTPPRPTHDSLLNHPMWWNSLCSWSLQWDAVEKCTENTIMRMRPWQQGKPVERKASPAIQKLKETHGSLPQGSYTPRLKTNFSTYMNTLHSLRHIAKKSVNFAPHKAKFTHSQTLSSKPLLQGILKDTMMNPHEQIVRWQKQTKQALPTQTTLYRNSCSITKGGRKETDYQKSNWNQEKMSWQ